MAAEAAMNAISPSRTACCIGSVVAAGIDHKRRTAPNAYLGRKPSYDRATLDRVLSAFSNASAL